MLTTKEQIELEDLLETAFSFPEMLSDKDYKRIDELADKEELPNLLEE